MARTIYRTQCSPSFSAVFSTTELSASRYNIETNKNCTAEERIPVVALFIRTLVVTYDTNAVRALESLTYPSNIRRTRNCPSLFFIIRRTLSIRQTDHSADEYLVVCVANFLTGVRNVTAMMRWLNLANRQRTFVASTAYVQRFTRPGGSALNSSSGKTTITSGLPGELRLWLGYKDLILSVTVLLTAPRHVATLVRWYNFAGNDILIVFWTTNVQSFARWIISTVNGVQGDVWATGGHPLAQGAVGAGCQGKQGIVFCQIFTRHYPLCQKQPARLAVVWPSGNEHLLSNAKLNKYSKHIVVIILTCKPLDLLVRYSA